MIYLDNSATTPVYPEVLKMLTDVTEQCYGNPSSLHHLGVKAERLVEQARKVVAEALDSTPQEVLFTSGGTEANNMAIRGIVEQYQGRGQHIITTMVEHPSVFEVFTYLEKKGFRVTYLPVDKVGRIHLHDLKKAMTDETILVSVMHVNNEVGTVQPIEEIGVMLEQYPKALFHVDAVQSYGKIPLSVRKAKIDALSLSAHKLHGPKGIGALYLRKQVTIKPLIIGGGQESGMRSGTQNVPGIAGLAKATILAIEGQARRMNQFQQWKDRFIKEVVDKLDHVMVNGDQTPVGGAPYIINLSFPGMKSEVLVHALEQEHVLVSSKSACSSKNEKSSRVLSAMGLSNEAATSSIRVSMGYQTEEQDIMDCAYALARVVPNLQQVMKVRRK
ncbi:cysteine desulfurase [Thermoactinomyces sp. DSM 45891]|uniref:cysteine desulfurase family protein n=1 Tax=Thermoactinomyces sp. DSM 45891 TaxID=1761907 RepID=UPI000917223A|nr:cysteine desulfurase family protein [Thermoactinomyces sp. DSM 45891]SFX28643.1 cysteine desulfurase [Thermoactinomyces sp. DSM 45891]